jgi:hypothetical protein
MRKVEVLEESDGHIILRATEFDNRNAHVFAIHLEHYEAQALAKALLNLEDQGDETPTIDRAQPVLSTLKATLDSIASECFATVERQLKHASNAYKHDLCNACGVRRDAHHLQSSTHEFVPMFSTVPLDKL